MSALLTLSLIPAMPLYASCSGFGFTLLPGGPAPNTSVALGGEVAVQAVTADFNGDGIPDVATGNVNSGNIVIALGTGSGLVVQTAASPIDLPGDSRATGLAVGDFNEDGIVDLVVSHLIVGATVFLGNGSGGFVVAGSVNYGTGANIMERVAVADFNSDGNLDIALTDAGPDRLRLAFGNGQGGLAVSGTLLVSPDLDLPLDVAAGDVDGDGDVDLLTVGGLSDRLIVFAGDGAGGFTPVQSLPAVIDASASPRSVSLADVNADGRPDALVSSSVRRSNGGVPPSPFDRALVYHGTSGGALAAPFGVQLGNDLSVLFAADLDADGRMDLAAANPAFSFHGSIARAEPGGGFGLPLFLPARASTFAVADDFDVDGFMDFAILNSADPPSLSIYINNCVEDPIFSNGFEGS